MKQLDAQAYQRLHQKLLHKQTRKQTKKNDSMTDPIKNPLVLQTKSRDQKVMYAKYRFQSGPTLQFPKQFYS